MNDFPVVWVACGTVLVMVAMLLSNVCRRIRFPYTIALVLAGMLLNDLIPDDGGILKTTTCHASQGDTVFDVLQNAARTYRILIDNRGSDGAAYIAGIDGLYEFDYGDLSGWMYRVNGAFPDVGCQSCTVHDGDRIEWLYTTNIGKDL